MRTQRLDAATATIDDFGGEFLVVCPRCAARALVRDKGSQETNTTRRIVLTCSACGLSRFWEGNWWTKQNVDSRPVAAPVVSPSDGPEDWYFHLPLWLQTPCCGEVLWAYNADHLDFLEDFVRATLRENVQTERGWSNQSLRSRLPTWMKTAHNRDAVLKGIERLKGKANLV